MYHVSAQGVDERMINAHYYYYYYVPRSENRPFAGSSSHETAWKYQVYRLGSGGVNSYRGSCEQVLFVFVWCPRNGMAPSVWDF